MALLFLLIISSCAGFNFDTQHIIVTSDPHNNLQSHFGYTVALQRLTVGQNTTAWVLVGAPRSKSTYPQHVYIDRPGVMFKCPVMEARMGSCEQFVLDPTGNSAGGYYPNHRYQDKKDDARISGAMDVGSSENGAVVVCGPGWKNQLIPDQYLMNGVCYSLPDALDSYVSAQKMLPLVDRTRQLPSNTTNKNLLYYFAQGEAGLSVHLTDSSELLIGAPGVLMWTGAVVMYRYTAINNQWSLMGITDPFKINKLEGEAYMGYTVSSGRFFSSDVLYVSSAPRLSYKGTVYLFEFADYTEGSIDIRAAVSGQQMGEYFGASLCVVDWNSDGLDDLLVGAPLHTSQVKQGVGGDEGRVYVYASKGNGVLQEVSEQLKLKLQGSNKPGARFGMSISVIGDINYDGYPDIAVGAPYERQAHTAATGAVYIYLGGKKGFTDTFVQRIHASVVRDEVRGFGISLSRGVDIDDNYYQDLAVGAAESAHVTVIKSKPVITFKPRIEASKISIKEVTTTGTIAACLTYHGEHTVDELQVSITLTVDSLIYLPDTSSQVTTLRINTESCVLFVFNTKAHRVARGSPVSSVDVSMTFKLLPPDSVVFLKHFPVTDPSSPARHSVKLPVTQPCGSVTCTPLWRLNSSFGDLKLPLVLGYQGAVSLTTTLHNEGESSYLKSLSIMFPEHIRPLSHPVECNTIDSPTDGFQLTCYEAFVVNNGGKVHINISLNTLDIPSTVTSQQFHVSVHNFENVSVVSQLVTLPLVTQYSFTVLTKALPPRLFFDHVNNSTISHIYDVRSTGLTSVESAVFTIRIPRLVTIGNYMAVPLLDIYRPEVDVGVPTRSCQLNGSYEFLQELDSPDFLTNITDSELESLLNKVVSASTFTLWGTRTVKIHCEDETVLCETVLCAVGPMNFDESVTVSVRMKILARVVDALTQRGEVLELSTQLTVNILPDTSQFTPLTQSVHTDLEGNLQHKTSPYLWLYILLASLFGLLVLVLIIVCLCKKTNFFKRQRTGDSTEAEETTHMRQDERGTDN